MAKVNEVFGPTMDATKEIQDICDVVKPKVEEKTGMTFDTFTATQYRRKNVNGKYFLIKVHVGKEDDYIHLSVYETDGVDTLEGVEPKQTKDSTIVPF